MTDDLTPPHWGPPEEFKETCHRCGKQYWPNVNDGFEIGVDDQGRRYIIGAICKECHDRPEPLPAS